MSIIAFVLIIITYFVFGVAVILEGIFGIDKTEKITAILLTLIQAAIFTFTLQMLWLCDA